MFDEADRLLTDESFQGDLKVIMDSVKKQETTRDHQGNGRQTFLYSATMTSRFDEYLSQETLFGTDFRAEDLVECGTGDETDEMFTKTVQGLK